MINVLVVDDFATNGAIIKKILPHDRFQVKCVISGPQALNYIDSGKKTDIVLLDMNMPEMDGLETLKRMRKLEQGRSIPIMFVTGVADRERVMEGFKNGIDDIIAKPVDSDFLLERVERALKGETPVQLYKKRNGIDEGIKSLYDTLYGELSDSVAGMLQKSMGILEAAAAESAGMNSEAEDEYEEEDEDEDFGIDMNGILNQNLW